MLLEAQENGLELLLLVKVRPNLSFTSTNDIVCSLAISCAALDPPTNGQVSFSTDATPPHVFGTVATFSCATGYGLHGDVTRTCGGDGSFLWTGSPPTCNGEYWVKNFSLMICILFLPAYTCPTLTLIPNGMITYDPDRTPPFIFGTTATYSCNQGFYPSHTSVRTCTGSGATSFWDGTAPNCLG